MILLKQSDILLMIRIQNLSVTDIRNPVLGTQNPKRGIQNPRLSWITFYRASCCWSFSFFFNLNSIIDVLKNNVYHVPEL